jgi:hypothetical protein
VDFCGWKMRWYAVTINGIAKKAATMSPIMNAKKAVATVDPSIYVSSDIVSVEEIY